jgi:hypothetical protein
MLLTKDTEPNIADFISLVRHILWWRRPAFSRGNFYGFREGICRRCGHIADLLDNCLTIEYRLVYNYFTIS